MEIYTIGFTQTTAEHFFTRLSTAGVRRLLDVRLNNSSQLAGFAKARDLPFFLRELVDHRFWPARARVLGRVSPARYIELLRGHAQPSLQAIFGEDLVRHEWTYAIDQHHGAASLGVLRVRRKPDIAIDKFGKLRLRLNDARRPAFLPVTDLRFVEADHRTIKADVLADVRARMRRGVDVLLMVGLARAFQREGDECARHWLQVNGVCMVDQPLGERP